MTKKEVIKELIAMVSIHNSNENVLGVKHQVSHLSQEERENAVEYFLDDLFQSEDDETNKLLYALIREVRNNADMYEE